MQLQNSLPSGGRPAVFLDRDGTLTERRHYPARPDDLVLQPGIGPPLRALREHGAALVLVTNQSGLARGLFDEADLAAMHEHLGKLLSRLGVRLDGVYTCPHHPDGTVLRYRIVCQCRKPATGMLRQATHDLRLDLARSWMVGDSGCDIEAGQEVGTRTALVAERPLSDGLLPDVHETTTAGALDKVRRSVGRLSRPTGCSH
ncbi:D-glycero-alpha-D-manno-heptose-1,7-bisphosphate 7-phosphatase [Streptomyces scopuliridis]|uniref:D-glycero-alpha-D-manno-heptose-1,7-bisphosphate 7-phosphatase n=1 Tax=Streptomyces scopuliridis TaxID=452529 RepID=UPI0036CF517E